MKELDLSGLPDDPRVRTRVLLALAEDALDQWQAELERRVDAAIEANLMLERAAALVQVALGGHALSIAEARRLRQVEAREWALEHGGAVRIASMPNREDELHAREAAE